MARRGIVPDVLTDQTSAHDPLNGYVPNGMTLEEARALRTANPRDYQARAIAAMGVHVEAMLALQRAGAVTFDYGNNIRTQAKQGRRGARLRHSRLRARVHPAAVLRRARALPLGGAFGRSGRHLPHRPPGARNVPRERDAGALDSDGPPADSFPGPAGAYLLAGLWRARRIRRGHEPAGAARRDPGAHRDRPRPSGRRLGGFALPRNRGHARWLATPSPIGHCSTRW